MTTPLPAVLRAVTEEALLLAQSLGQAEGAQWERAHVPQPREDTTERASGGHGDPTFDTVADDRRLSLRLAVVKAEADLGDFVGLLRATRENLDRGLARWAGEI